MPFLPLDLDIATNPNRTHLALIESFMLFPDNEPALDAYKAAVVQIGRELKRELLSAELLGELLDLTENAKSLRQLQGTILSPYRDGLSPFQDGLMAGNALIAALFGKSPEGSPLKLRQVHEMLRQRFAKRGGSESSFVHKIWKRYRSVAHLWAAHIQIAELEPSCEADSRSFPCRTTDVTDFLWLSERWRELGERTKSAPKAPTTILRPGEAWRVPEAMKFSK
jgi:hypothetical protein